MLCSDTKICLSEEDGLHTECLMHHASLFIATRYRGVFALEGLVAALVLVTPAHRHHRPSHNLLFVASSRSKVARTRSLGAGPARAKLLRDAFSSVRSAAFFFGPEDVPLYQMPPRPCPHLLPQGLSLQLLFFRCIRDEVHRKLEEA